MIQKFRTVANPFLQRKTARLTELNYLLHYLFCILNRFGAAEYIVHVPSF